MMTLKRLRRCGNLFVIASRFKINKNKYVIISCIEQYINGLKWLGEDTTSWVICLYLFNLDISYVSYM